ncbi:hypothetical protein F0562_003062 [Nyssa sinensis]|uniref:Uncharacterized protein n=1 Tax=Nyssa sinensis TaxID=561372 RepID=A0A5J5BTF1_9ASTE|nr:hypothetical protein F0562_003062 [Nyssa sinensis]
MKKGSSDCCIVNHQPEQSFYFVICPAVVSPLSISDQASSRVRDIVVSLGPQTKVLRSVTSARFHEHRWSLSWTSRLRQWKEQVIEGLGCQWNWLEELQLGATELELLEQQLRISEQLPDQVTSGFQYLIDGLALPVFTISSVFMLTLWGLVTTVATRSGGLATTKISEVILMLWDCTIFDTLIVTTGGNY